MKQLISAKLKLHTTPEQFQVLRQAQLAYRDALNHVSRYAFEHGKMSNQRALQKQTYLEIRARYGLPSQMACNVPSLIKLVLYGFHGQPLHQCVITEKLPHEEVPAF